MGKKAGERGTPEQRAMVAGMGQGQNQSPQLPYGGVASAPTDGMGPRQPPAQYDPRKDATNYGYEGQAVGEMVAQASPMSARPEGGAEQFKGSAEEQAFVARMSPKSQRAYAKGKYRHGSKALKDAAEAQFNQRNNAPQIAWDAQAATNGQQSQAYDNREARADDQRNYFAQNPNQERLMQQETATPRTQQQRAQAQANYLRESGLDRKATVRTNVPARVANQTNNARQVQGATARPGAAPMVRG